MAEFIILRKDKGANIYEAPTLCQPPYQHSDSASPRSLQGGVPYFYSYNVRGRGKEPPLPR